MLKAFSIVVAMVAVLPALLPAQGGYYPRPGQNIGPHAPNPSAYKVAGSFHGKLKELTAKEIMIETDDSQIVSIHRSHKTKFLNGAKSIKASDIDIGTPVTVDASEDVDLSLTAISVTVDPPKKNTDSK
jgi:hypothetical protein